MKLFIVFTAIIAVSSAGSIGDFIKGVIGETVDKTKDFFGGFIDKARDAIMTVNSVRGILDQALDRVGEFHKSLKNVQVQVPGQPVKDGDKKNGEKNKILEEINENVTYLITVIAELANSVGVGETDSLSGKKVGDLVQDFINNLMNCVDNIRNGIEGTENKFKNYIRLHTNFV